MPTNSIPKQAVVVIHGMGEQRPMETIKGFVRTVWATDTDIIRQDMPDAAAVWSKPDTRTGSLELRRITTRPSRDSQTFPHGVRTDFYELYWADLSGGSTWSNVKDWFWMILWRNPLTNVPSNVFLAWLVLWGAALLFSALGVATIVPRDASVMGLQLWSVPPLSFLVGFQMWQLGAMTAAVGVITHRFVVPYIGRVVRYTRAKPENIAARKKIRERGLALLNHLHDREYERIVIAAHSLGAILAYDLITHFWAARTAAHTMREGDLEFDLLVKLQKASADLAQADQVSVEEKREAYLKPRGISVVSCANALSALHPIRSGSLATLSLLAAR